MTIREAFDSLPPEGQRAVVEVFSEDLDRGWIPREADLRAVIETVRSVASRHTCPPELR